MYSEFFWAFFIQLSNWEIFLISPYSVRMRENTDQKDSEYGQFSRSATDVNKETLDTLAT